ncbi:hypothetical protein DM01DRAFT_1031632 [Hesseltinella vesiculosa]|uniref:Autophagy-related protein 14 n=1 Tax=Hesseltinella vesiculosa TaxID=101127 RepID=A0A1X2GJF1_9FUNG|nr:hypothetical protein DM01DRAFT_1031632 [Hesseltinella vesiculosa]
MMWSRDSGIEKKKGAQGNPHFFFSPTLFSCSIVYHLGLTQLQRMQCHYCRCYNRKFYCKSCLTEKLLDHSKEVARTRKERDHAIHQAQIHLEATEASHRLLVEKTKRTMHLDQLANAQHQTTKDTAQLRMDIDQLKQNLAERRQRLHQSKQVQAQACSELEDVDDIRLKAWQRTHKLTTRTRQILVREVASLFNVKAGVVEENTDDDLHSCSPPPLSSHPPLQPAPSDSTTLATSDTIDPVENMPFSRSTTLTQQVRRPVVEDLYICGVSLPTRLIDISIYPKEELNSTIGYICQMMELIIQYLGIKLPFTLFRKDTHQYIRSPPHSKFYPNQSKMPLFMDDDHNFRRFLTAIAMLNYDVAYLCHTQGIDIPLSQVANTLQNLMTCCQAPNLGIRSHATIYQGLMEMQYSVDFQQVLRQTGLRQAHEIETLICCTHFL